MKRYTLRYQPIGASIDPDELRDEVEQVLLHLHPRITYKMAQVFQGADRKPRLLLSERFGCKDKSVVLRTIIKRAGSSYVEGNFQYLMYRKPDAIDIHPVKNT